MSDRCELPAHNATPDEILHILKTARRIAVVGHSDNPARDSYRVGRYLAEQGYEVFPVNPRAHSPWWTRRSASEPGRSGCRTAWPTTRRPPGLAPPACGSL
jgi:hypothetical protein